MGGPTDSLLLIVESIDTRAHMDAVSMLTSGVIILSSIGLLYLLSPICSYVVSAEVEI